MRILVTGANGFVGRNLAAALTEHEVTKLTRQIVDLTNRKAVDEYFKDKKIWLHRVDFTCRLLVKN